MPLHLLGKKSWNVYNSANVEKVKKDEADAALRAEERDRVRQEQDAAHRTALLRGEAPPLFAPLSPSDDEGKRHSRKRTHVSGAQVNGDVQDQGGEMSKEDRKRRRKMRGEDDTDHAIRIAALHRESAGAARANFASSRKEQGLPDKEVEIIDHAGHIQLFAPPDEKKIRKDQKNAEAEAEKKKKEKELEDQYTMRFSNAGGFNKNVSSAPWYASTSQPKASALGPDGVSQTRAEGDTQETEGKNVWGRPDPARKERDAARVSTNDPFAMMQKAQGQLKQAVRDREAWRVQKEAESKDLERAQKEARRAEKEERRRRRDLADKMGRESRSKDGSREYHRERRDETRRERRDETRRERRDETRRESVDSLEGFSLDAPARESEHEKKHMRNHDYETRHRTGNRERGERTRYRSRSREHDRQRRHRSSRHETQHRRRSRSPR